jgi:hypothetical protein
MYEFNAPSREVFYQYGRTPDHGRHRSAYLTTLPYHTCTPRTAQRNAPRNAPSRTAQRTAPHRAPRPLSRRADGPCSSASSVWQCPACSRRPSPFGSTRSTASPRAPHPHASCVPSSEGLCSSAAPLETTTSCTHALWLEPSIYRRIHPGPRSDSRSEALVATLDCGTHRCVVLSGNSDRAFAWAAARSASRRAGDG